MRAPSTYKINTYTVADPGSVPVPVYPVNLFTLPARDVMINDNLSVFPEYGVVTAVTINDDDTVTITARPYFSDAITLTVPAGLMVLITRDGDND